MSKKLLPIILLTVLAISAWIILPAAAAKPTVVVHLKGGLEPDTQLTAIMTDLTYVTWDLVYDAITSADLVDAKMLIMVKVDSSAEYTADELSAIDSWFSTGGKSIWVAADSDYGTDHLRQATANAVLEAIGSSMRFDDASTEDATSNGGAPYRVLGISDNADPEIAFLVTGLERGLFHGPAVVVGYKGGSMVDLMTTSVDGVYVVMTTSETGIIVDNSEPAPEVLVAGDEGEFPLMAVEIDYDKGSMIIATGDAPFGQYVGLYKPEIIRDDRYGVEANPQQGGVLFDNIIKYVTTFGDDYMMTKAAEMDLMDDVTSLDGDVTGLEADVARLANTVDGLGDDIADLVEERSSLTGEVSSLTSDVAGLEADLSAAESSASTMQLVAIAALVIGAVVGFFVGPIIKKQ